MKHIAYSSSLVPPEWIAAHGLVPRRIIPPGGGRKGPVPPGQGVCPFMRCFINAVVREPGIAGIVLATVCDQMRHAKDILDCQVSTPSFLLNVPSVWQTPSAAGLFRSELYRLGRFLESVGGHAPAQSELTECMIRHEYLRNGAAPVPPPATRQAIPVAFVGGPLTGADLELYQIVASHGGQVALDATEEGERTRPDRFDPVRLQTDPVGELVNAYFGTIPDIFRRPNTALFTWLKREVAARQVRGVILTRQVWCDKWHAEAHRLRESLDVPLLDIDLDGEPCGSRTRIRLQAFLESLQ